MKTVKNMTSKNPGYVIVCGGTGGHIYPGLAVASAIRELEPGSRIIFIGTRGRMESRIVPSQGHSFRTITVKGIQRGWGLGIFFKNLQAFLLLLLGIPLWQSIWHLLKFRSVAVFATGGYFSGPVVLASYLLRIPAIGLEPNVVPGIANRLSIFFLDKLLITYEETGKYFSRSGKCIKLGTPIRGEIFSVSREESLKHFDLEEGRLTVLVMGGSLGSKKINQEVRGFIELLQDSTDSEFDLGERIQVVHSLGRRYGIDSRVESSDEKIIYKPFEYIDRVEYILPAVDVFIGRVGASSIAEMTALGIPMVLIPWSGVHQVRNAQVLANLGAAILLREDEFTSRLLYDLLKSFIERPIKLKEMASNSKKIGNPDSAKEIAEYLLSIARYGVERDK